MFMMTILSKHSATISSELLELLWHPHRASVDYLSHMVLFPVGTTDMKCIFLGVAHSSEANSEKKSTLCCTSHKESLKAKPKPLLSQSIKLLFLSSFSLFWVFQKNNLKQNPKHAATFSLKLILHDCLPACLHGRKNG